MSHLEFVDPQVNSVRIQEEGRQKGGGGVGVILIMQGMTWSAAHSLLGASSVLAHVTPIHGSASSA